MEFCARGEFSPRKLSESGIRHIRKLLDDFNLKLCGLRFPTRRGYHVAEDLEARVDATKAAMRLAYQLRAPLVANQIGRVPDEGDPARETMIDSLTDLGRHGERVGSMFAAETGTEPGESLAELLDSLPTRAVHVAFHPGNLLVNGFSATEAVESLGSRIVQVYAADGVRDLARGRGLETQLGRGSADFPELIGRLEEHGYRGVFVIDRRGSAEIEAEIADAVSYLRELGV